MAREALKNFARDTGRNLGNNRIAYTVEQNDGESIDQSGLGKEPTLQEELIGINDPAVGLIGDFLKYVVDNSTNSYKFLGGNSLASSGKRGQELGDPAAGLENDPFVSNSELRIANESWSDSQKLDLENIIDKVGGTPRGEGVGAPRSANDLLKGVIVSDNPSDEEDFLVKETYVKLSQNLKYDDIDRFTNDIDSVTLDFESEGLTIEHKIERMKEVGLSLLYRASGYDTNEDPGTSSATATHFSLKNSDLIANGNLENTNLQEIQLEAIQAKNAVGAPFDSRGKSVKKNSGINIDYSSSKYHKTRGNTFNEDLSFTTISDGLKIKTYYRMAALGEMLRQFFNTALSDSRKDSEEIKSSIKDISASSHRAFSGKEKLGKSHKSAIFAIKNYLYLVYTPTDFDFYDCFEQGLRVLFGNDLKKNASLDSVKNNQEKKSIKISDSPGFWLSISKFITHVLGQIEIAASSESPEKNLSSIFLDSDSRIVRIINVVASIGEKSLHYNNAIKEIDRGTGPRNVDDFDNIPGNRVSKSRIGKFEKSEFGDPNLGSENTLAWEQSATPSVYLLPANIIRAAGDLNSSVVGANPARGMFGSRLVRNTYTSIDTDGTGAKIPHKVVKIVEDRLEAEYVPFYFHDLRTNEIVSFHAFLGSLSDSINPSYNATSAFGRLDPVQSYTGTTRSINVEFTVYATNREDFDDMWYKINKIVTLLYPQWTQGMMVQSGEQDSGSGTQIRGAKFYQPFTQIVGSSPIIRLRIGDVIKSNYSKFALARLFGIGDQAVEAQPVTNEFLTAPSLIREFRRKWRDIGLTLMLAVFGSPLGIIETLSNSVSDSNPLLKAAANMGTDAAASLISEFLVNGFVNPLALNQVINLMKDPNTWGSENGWAANQLASSDKLRTVYISPNFINGYFSYTEGRNIFISKKVLGKVLGVKSDSFGKSVYEVEIKEDDGSNKLAGHKIAVRHEDIWNNVNSTFTNSALGYLFLLSNLDLAGTLDTFVQPLIRKGTGSTAGDIGASLGAQVARFLLSNPETVFMDRAFNPIVENFENNMGRGLAGVMKGITFNWMDEFPWETDYNARAPIGVKIGFSFDVIHDIPPGLDHTGYNRAPLYNVGEIMKNVAGDVYNDYVSQGEKSFTRGGSKGKYISGYPSRFTGKK